MTNTSKTIVFFGTEHFSLHVLKALIENGYPIGAVVTKPDSKQGRGQTLRAPEIKSFAQSQDIPVWQPRQVQEIRDSIKNLGDVAGVLVSYGKIIPAEIINLFNPGIINVHPSLLPKYRGPSPIESAILNNDERTGISIIKLTSEMDAGPIYHQAEVELYHSETSPELTRDLVAVSIVELLQVLPDILSGSLQPIPQDETQATYCPLLSKTDAWLDPTILTAEQAERRVRAFLEFPRTKIAVNGHDIIITKTHTSDEGLSPLDIRFKDGHYLSIDELIGQSGRKMSAKDFLNGYRIV